MRIIFHTLKYKNFLSTGNDFNEIQLDRNPTTVIVGANGSGKTTLIDALTFALFGKAFRNINKPKLVNSINGQDCLTELTFTIGTKLYRIVRGIKPNIFEIYINGKMIDQNAGIKDYQGYLEKNILHFNYKAFAQIIVLGSKSYIPFMRLVAADRRIVVEDLLDLQIFSAMTVTLKKRSDGLKSDIENLQNDINLTKERIKIQTKLVTELSSRNDDTIDINNKSINTTKLQINQLEEEISTLENQIQNFSIKDNTPLKQKISEMENIFNKLSHRTSSLNKEIQFFQDNETCPTCYQSLTESFRSTELDNRKQIYQTITDGKLKLTSQIDKTKSSIIEIDKILKQVSILQNQINEKKGSIKLYNEWIKKTEKQNSDILENSEDITENKILLDEYLSELAVSKKSYETLLDEKKYVEYSISLLKDNGIKAAIIKQYIPVINGFINNYLSFMDFFVNFSLDEQFEERIYSRFRDEFCYENFSDGEKLRLDLAILFAWRSVAKIKNSIDTNILILDEILDSSLDPAGIEDFFKLMHSLQGSGTNMFIISHQGDILTDKFNHVIKFEKKNNFSEMTE